MMTLLPLPTTTLRPYEVKDIARLRGQFITESYTVAGVLHWTANDAVIPPSVFKDAYITMPEGQQAAHDKSVDEICAAYRANQPAQPSAEDMFEMRAAFGPGKEIVNIITGRVTRT
jgi:hypothetical protein